MVRSALARWLLSFSPSPVGLGWPERFRSCLGALLGISFTAGVMHVVLGDNALIPLLVAPMGASAVLLFAVPASPLAQPWSIIGGNIVSAVIGVACATWITNPIDAAPIAVAMSIGAMFAFRCVHPPSGAVALTAVLGGPAVHALGFGFVFAPIAAQSFALLAVAIVFHASTGHRYPHAARSARETGVRAPAASPGFTRADLEAVLGRRNELLDIDPGDLESLLLEIQLQSYVRGFSGLSCADIMSSPVVSVTSGTAIATAAAMLKRHGIKALPVIDDRAFVVGIITAADVARNMAAGKLRVLATFIERWFATPGSALTVASIMTTDVSTVSVITSIAKLVPIFAAYGHHHIPVLDTQEKLAGMITQADLILGLYRQTHA
ncbi:HPP family protein (plasmid) [Caballeronia sp. SBC1]|uniref:HPP family protein n=1 Tax=unclassified Caballeronia TaxID=2646786 RepID=UPI0013E182DF|nr:MULTISPECIES: HPP family protein [unclassified Caballeronia]QIE29140.1 HPP family protein [Caballeronia sp. SBC2]QIN67364.1 HPP family protein [Caballeronia sp. SBC1]